MKSLLKELEVSFELSTDPDDSSNKTGKIVTSGGNDWETAELILDEPIKVVSGADNTYSLRIYNPTAAQDMS